MPAPVRGQDTAVPYPVGASEEGEGAQWGRPSGAPNGAPAPDERGASTRVRVCADACPSARLPSSH